MHVHLGRTGANVAFERDVAAAHLLPVDGEQPHIVGIEHGYIDSQQQTQLLHQIQTTQPKIILVALGMPRQEIWIRDNFHLCPQAIWIGVGGSFDVWSGSKNRAPQYIRNLDLEWMYRIAQEPSRWRRALALPQFAVRAVAERIWSKQKLASK